MNEIIAELGDFDSSSLLAEQVAASSAFPCPVVSGAASGHPDVVRIAPPTVEFGPGGLVILRVPFSDTALVQHSASGFISHPGLYGSADIAGHMELRLMSGSAGTP